jgi:7-cyano-7-deazaguanine synthase in queuosine biosynthesis
MKNAIILCSGGLDSATTSYYAKKTLKYQNIIILFFNYQQRTITKERQASQKIAKQLNADFKEINLKELSTISTSLINSNKEVKQVRRQDLKNTKEE